MHTSLNKFWCVFAAESSSAMKRSGLAILVTTWVDLKGTMINEKRFISKDHILCVSYFIVSDSLWSHGLWPARLLCPWNSPGRHPFSRESSDSGIKPGSLALSVDSLPSEPPGKPIWTYMGSSSIKLYICSWIQTC